MRDGRWTILFDVDRCNGCSNCILATLDEHADHDHLPHSAAMPRHGAKWFDLQTIERGAFPTVDVAYVPKTCMHCDDAPCVAAGSGAVKRRDDGLIVIDPGKAKGREDLVNACPFGAIHWNDQKDLPQHWTLDAHLLDAGWKEPRAAQACPTGALTVRKMSVAEVNALPDQSFLQPAAYRKVGARLHIRGLQRIEAVLVGGSVAQSVDEREEPVVGVEVTLVSAEGHRAQAVTDPLGGFRFDGLPHLQGPIRLSIRQQGNDQHWDIPADPQRPGHYSVGVLTLAASVHHDEARHAAV